MELEFWMIAFLCLAYFSGGFVDSIAGGGGLIIVPSFLLTGIPPDFILGTNKFCVSFGTFSSMLMYARHKAILWKLATLGVPAAMLGGYLGAEAILLFDSEIVSKLILFLLPVGAVLTLLPKKTYVESKELGTKELYILGPLICFVLGFYDGFFGPGTGSFFILAFHFVLGMNLLNASATTKVFNFMTGIGSLVAFIMNGKVLFVLAIPLIISNILGNVIGSRLALRIGAPFIQKILLVSIALLFVTLLTRL